MRNTAIRQVQQKGYEGRAGPWGMNRTGRNRPRRKECLNSEQWEQRMTLSGSKR